ncbi:MAG: TonB-dependent receptor [Rhodospirillum sp.]|nr:TonB-dependent receptor [Rhodospirillum sp.]
MAWTRIGMVAAVWLAATSTLAWAQETAPSAEQQPATTGEAQPAPDAAEGQQGPVVLRPVSVSATRNPIEAFEYPGMVTVIDPNRPDLRNASTPDDLLNRVPNVEFTGGPRRTGEDPSIRGFSGPDVVIMIDGARQNIDTGHEGRFYLDPSLIGEVEVLRGSASALYGSGGSGGVFSFQTLDADDLLAPDETIGFRVRGGYQSVNDEPMGSFTLYGKPGAGIDLLGSVTKRNSGDIELGDGEQLDSSDDIVAGLVKAGIDLHEFHRVEASFMRFDNDAEEPLNGQDFLAEDATEKSIETDTTRLAYSYSNPDDKLLDLDITLYYTDFQVDALRLDDLGAGAEGEKLKRSVDTLGFRAENSSRVEVSDGAGLVFTYGAEGYQDKQDGESASGDRDGVPDAEADFIGGFFQTELRVEEPFGFVPGEVILLGGVRYDHYSASSDIAASNEDDAVSPRVGLSYMPTEWSMLFANYGEAFRAPTINEMYNEGVHFVIPGFGTNFFVANPNLRPQTTETVEVGGGLDFADVITTGDRLSVKGSYFWIKGEDFISLSVDQPGPPSCFPPNCNGTTSASNVARAKLWGSEVEASYENERVRFGFGYSDIDGKDRDTGDHLGSLTLTSAQFTLDAALKLPEIDSIVGWRAFIADDFDEVNEGEEDLKRDGYDVHDLYFSWAPTEMVIEGLQVDLGIENIFDASYARVYTDSKEPGRNYRAAVSYSLNF